ncbi:hypothetical protein BN11_1730008 [Nostocoides australiense Ben110]|uniref:Uncharacterized protein n=1 Tax=Nostocoides australiense Ben110 TaxID=1193182 RepID=W6JTA1_9MICO|nr:hypothetical protein BN11_1730008 [Tetrasphaera australiensis Ben110]
MSLPDRSGFAKVLRRDRAGMGRGRRPRGYGPAAERWTDSDTQALSAWAQLRERTVASGQDAGSAEGAVTRAVRWLRGSYPPDLGPHGHIVLLALLPRKRRSSSGSTRSRR